MLDNVLAFPSFQIGQIVVHKKYHYRAVIFKIDQSFKGPEKWYEHMAIDNPPKDRPWYSLLVHNTVHTTYVPQQNLILAKDIVPIQHPLLIEFFNKFNNGRYYREENSISVI